MPPESRRPDPLGTFFRALTDLLAFNLCRICCSLMWILGQDVDVQKLSGKNGHFWGFEKFLRDPDAQLETRAINFRGIWQKLAHMVSSMFACHKNVIVYYIEGIRQSTPYYLPSPNPVPPFCFEIKILLKNWKGALEIMECLSGRILHFKAFLGYLRFFINILFHPWDTSTNLHPHKVLYAQTVWSKFEVITQSCAGVMLICFFGGF